MELLVIEPCRYTQMGIDLFIKDEKNININYIDDITSIRDNHTTEQMDFIFANLSVYCQHHDINRGLQAFLHRPRRAVCFIYTQAHYPYTKQPLYLKNGIYLINKKMTPALLHLISRLPHPPALEPAYPIAQIYGAWPLLTAREISVLHDWMQQIVNHRIAQRLHLSPRTIYAHKRRIIEKMHVRNRIELCYLYNLLRHLY
ncbi:helix-turn-helix transcriptional regulator [Edwardsiella hoshinae]|uniref:Colanic acid capsular biosynthesis activation protein A n=1 Tax=Edwardsiella hoshinae TaxID=93378 RepID=A0A376DD03_9GAMM|nr:helix-turn-helix transcriptional regulator [Edwardsiella hoshinae]AOV96655.1 helix-turn-helix transcriptional regulator [Edwardsiella hoshinae]QPR27450.1 helix-turn-helix transcriptional regulator [Edwardsiella hoshinae]STC87199.1 colanic acid capsular biosynthesis activation protein A [Edwardsiella hoshinae]